MARHDDMPRKDDPTNIEPRPRPAPDRGPGATEAQLRQDIDSGATGDKVPVLDPATVPLGADAEASGAPPTPQAAAKARDTERTEFRSPEHPLDRRGADPNALRLLGALVALAALGGAALWITFG